MGEPTTVTVPLRSLGRVLQRLEHRLRVGSLDTGLGMTERLPYRPVARRRSAARARCFGHTSAERRTTVRRSATSAFLGNTLGLPMMCQTTKRTPLSTARTGRRSRSVSTLTGSPHAAPALREACLVSSPSGVAVERTITVNTIACLTDTRRRPQTRRLGSPLLGRSGTGCGHLLDPGARPDARLLVEMSPASTSLPGPN
jgi:hypothetical protein